MIDLSICIVGDNHRSFLEPCLKSIYDQRHNIKYEVFVVDNNSSDGSAEFVESYFQEAYIIKNTKKFGFAKNNNQAILKSKGRYILLLNPDTIVLPNALERMVTFMDSCQEAGACGPKLLNPNGSLQYSCRTIPKFHTILIRRTPLRRIFSDQKFNKEFFMIDWDHNSIKNVDWVLGACLLVRKEVIKKVGLLDENYPLYVEDADWCYRIRKAGWKIYYYPDAEVVHHLLQETYKKFFTKKTLLHYKGYFRFLKKHWKSLLANNIIRKKNS